MFSYVMEAIHFFKIHIFGKCTFWSVYICIGQNHRTPKLVQKLQIMRVAKNITSASRIVRKKQERIP